MIATETEKRTVFIYGLRCPIEGVVRYVGQAVNPQARFKAHVMNPSTDRVSDWIRPLRASGRTPELVILETANTDSASDRELFWIRHFHALHGDLVLNHDGVKTDSPRGGFREGAGRKPDGDKALDSALIVKCLSEDKARWLAGAGEKSLGAIIRTYLNRRFPPA
jgi:hypothetical protein